MTSSTAEPIAQDDTAAIAVVLDTQTASVAAHSGGVTRERPDGDGAAGAHGEATNEQPGISKGFTPHTGGNEPHSSGVPQLADQPILHESPALGRSSSSSSSSSSGEEERQRLDDLGFKRSVRRTARQFRKAIRQPPYVVRCGNRVPVHAKWGHAMHPAVPHAPTAIAVAQP